MPPVTVVAATTKTVVISHGLTVADWIKAGAVVVAGIVAAQLVRRTLQRRLHADELEHQAIVVAGRFARLVVAAVAIFYALSLLGIQLGPLIGAIGIGGIAVALAAQSMLADLIASILLQTRRPFRRGDQIETNDHLGRVEDVNFRTVVLRSYDGQRVFLPASKVLNGPIINYSALGRRRTSLSIGLSYDADLEDAAARLLEAVRTVDGVHARPAPEVAVTEFGDSSMAVEVLYWHATDQATTRRLRSAVAIAAKRALDDAGIEIPFPQRVLRFADAPSVDAGGNRTGATGRHRLDSAS
ncbi:MAG TPA: mechanosensitive ion channel family protein [Acidimicrobiia bacterium]